MRYHDCMRFIIPVFFVCVASFTYAHTPFLVTQQSLHDITSITEPEHSRAFYGELTGFPHTYEIRAEKPFHLFAQILVPDIDSSKNNVSGIIIREVEGSGRVTEVARFLAKDAKWDTVYEPFGGDSYRNGGVFEQDVDRGVYRIEVSTPDNVEKYVLVVGVVEGQDDVGYFETIRRIAEIKTYFGKSKLLTIQSPLVYVPLLILLGMGLLGVWFYKRKKSSLQQM